MDTVLDLVEAFSGDVMQNLKAWAAAPPKMREQVLVPDEEPTLILTALASQNGPQPAADTPESWAGQCVFGCGVRPATFDWCPQSPGLGPSRIGT